MVVTHFIPRGWLAARPGGSTHTEVLLAYEGRRFTGPPAGPNAGHTWLEQQLPTWSPPSSPQHRSACGLSLHSSAEHRSAARPPQTQKGRVLLPPAAAEGAQPGQCAVRPLRGGLRRGAARPGCPGLARGGKHARPGQRRSRLPLEWCRPAHTRSGRPLCSFRTSVPRGAAPHNTAPPPARALGEAGAMSAWLRAASPPPSAALKPSSPLHRRARAAPCTWDPSTAAGRETRSCGSEWWGFPDVALPGVPKLKTSPHPTPPAFCRAAQSGLPGFARPRSATGAAASTTASPPLRSSSDLSRGLTASPAGSAHLRARRGHAGGGGEPWN